jgi:hypothetical protein
MEGLTMYSKYARTIELGLNNVACHVESIAAYGGAALTTVGVGATYDSYAAGTVAGLACAFAWFVRKNGTLSPAPYFVVTWLAWAAACVYGCLLSATPAPYLCLFAILWLTCGAFNFWFMLRVYPGDKQDPGAQVVQFGSGPAFWLLLAPLVLCIVGAREGLTVLQSLALSSPAGDSL